MKNVITGMVGHGFYNRNSAPQMAAIAHVLPWLEEACSSLPLDDGAPAIGLADFGCSEGRNSVAAMTPLVAALRRRSSRAIQTIHSDLPTNDFAPLLAALRPGGQSVFADPLTSSAIVGGSMFDRLLPPQSIHLACTFNAIGFLSRRPVERLDGYILPNGPSALRNVGKVSREDRALFARQAAQDIERFLQARAEELLPGGKLLVEVFGAGETLRTCDGIYDVLNDALLEMIDEGHIDHETYADYFQPVYFRTLDELTASVRGPDAPLAGLFQIDRAETYEIAVPFVETFRETGDVQPYARDYTNFFRAFTESALRKGLAAHPQCDDLVPDIYRRAERLVAEHPERYPFHYIGIAMLLTRKSGA